MKIKIYINVNNFNYIGQVSLENTKDDKLDKIFWFKFVFSVVVGILFGVLNFTGFISFAMYVKFFNFLNCSF